MRIPDHNICLWRLTVCVPGSGAGVDSVREQKKPEASLSSPTGQGKMLENAAESPASNARFVGRCLSKTYLKANRAPCVMGVI